MDRHTGIKGRVWILEDNLHLLSQSRQLGSGHLGHVHSPETDLTSGWFDQSQDGHGGCGLAATTFANYPQSLTFAQSQGNSVHGMYLTDGPGEEAFFDRKIDLQILYP